MWACVETASIRSGEQLGACSVLTVAFFAAIIQAPTIHKNG